MLSAYRQGGGNSLLKPKLRPTEGKAIPSKCALSVGPEGGKVELRQQGHKTKRTLAIQVAVAPIS
jgi:hypothetical protein